MQQTSKFSLLLIITSSKSTVPLFQFPWLMKLARLFGLRTGLNTYTELVNLLEKEVGSQQLSKVPYKGEGEGG